MMFALNMMNYVLKMMNSVEMAKEIASKDWAEDITAFSGDSSVNIWLEQVKNGPLKMMNCSLKMMNFVFK